MRISLILAIAVTTLLGTPAIADDRAALDKQLDNFLAATHKKQAHQRFWAEDLVYTSSSGARFGKETILQGFEGQEQQPATAAYRAEDVDIRLFGDTAVVAFRLVAEERAQPDAGDKPGDSAPTSYFNTGTFVKRDGEWRAVAWQATRIPAQED
ncbi:MULTISPECIES: nuclear transport factor 2 family protein [Microbulbifer]|uniref:nuclear transport factor 2 family protein n=1 Tax=Microbulbifer TaxID=48073 RepID=UPI001E4A7A06|nr:MULTISPECIES: nuclear transport factor 2 family protein [Microbulbifer]UHQ54821.1 nuclear transport factor 2 family protein [Microbulbifer sp. YPW16]